MNKKDAKLTIVVVMLLVLALYFVGGTYARYATDFSGEGSVQVAKWAVSLKDGQNAETTVEDLVFVVQSNPNVVPGKIAPAVTAVATVKVDLTGTEVAVDLTANLGDIAEDLAEIFGASVDDITVTPALSGANVSGTGETTIPLVGNSAFTSSNGVVTMTITVTWENDDDHNVSDTAVGVKAPEVTIPVTLTVEQHIG